MFRFCLPCVPGRGAGLGNEMIPWARAHLAAAVLGARCLRPAFGLNARGYRRHFGTSRLDWLGHRLLRQALPVVRFSEADYRAYGGGDVVPALQGFARAHGLFQRPAYVLVTEGMWGGFAHIEAAREYMAGELLHSRFAQRNLLRLRERLDPGKLTVGIHVRRGDFEPSRPPQSYQGCVNVALPLDWYRRVAESIHDRLGEDVQFLVVSDAPAQALQSLTQGLPCVLTGDLPDADCSDLLALARADLLVCSNSSYSLWAAFLSAAPYLWYGPQLHRHPQGFLSIWGYEEGQRGPDSPTQRAIQAGCVPPGTASRAHVVWHDGQVPALALEQALRHRPAPACRDLVRYGVVPVPAQQEPQHA